MVDAVRFAGRRLVVTGAGQGIGLAVAARAVAEGGQVLMVDRSEHVHQAAERIGAAATAITADLEHYAECVRVMAAADRIDVLVNNVGGTIWARPYAEYEEAQIEAEVRRSLFPTMWCCRAVLPHMLAAGRGVIVNVSSVATRGVNRVPYAAAKGGVNALTASLALEYAGHGIRVCAVAPGGTDAPPRRVPRSAAAVSEQEQGWYRQVVDQTIGSSPMHRYGTVDEQAAAILFLASDEASYITGTILPVAGGDQG